MNYTELIERALQRINELPRGTEFLLKDLFSDDEWGELGTYKGTFGRKFSEAMDENTQIGIEKIECAARRQNRYRKN